jgi:hypothetical protein
MNNRVRELIKEHGSDSSGKWVAVDKVELIAELIAYECMDLALGSSHREDDMGAIIANKIKKHFGVE